MIGPLGLLTIISVGLLSTSVSSVDEQCRPPPICVDNCLKDEILCRALGLYWQEMEDGNTTGAHNIKKPGIGTLFAVKYKSRDNKLHVEAIKNGGHIRSNNNGDMVLPIKILKNVGKTYSFRQTWPGTMMSLFHRGSPDIREAVTVVGIQDGEVIYLGRTIMQPFYYGTVALNKNKLTYELTYQDEENKEHRTNTFSVSLAEECEVLWTFAFPRTADQIILELGRKTARLVKKYYVENASIKDAA